MVQIATTDTDTERLLKGSLILEAEKQAHARSRAKMQTAVMHIERFLDAFEAKWDSDEKCDSPEEAIHYLDAAKFLQRQFNRNNRIEGVQKWVNEYLPWDQK